jgi:hypothetical protein
MRVVIEMRSLILDTHTISSSTTAASSPQQRRGTASFMLLGRSVDDAAALSATTHHPHLSAVMPKKVAKILPMSQQLTPEIKSLLRVS